MTNGDDSGIVYGSVKLPRHSCENATIGADSWMVEPIETIAHEFG